MKMPDWIQTMIRAARSDAEGPGRVDFTAPVHLTAAEGDAKRPTFQIDAYSGGPMSVSAFFSPVVVDLSGLRAARRTLPILLNHDLDRVIGQADSITIDASGVKLAGTITADDADAQKVVTNARNGFQWQASIGAAIERREYLEPGKTATVNGRQVTGPLIIARKARLIETSFVPIGADHTTSAQVAANAGDTDMNFEQWLKARGIENHDGLSESVRKTLKAAYDADQASAGEGDASGGGSPGDRQSDSSAASGTITAAGAGMQADVQKLVVSAVQSALAEAQKSWRAEQNRQAAIHRIAARHPEIAARAIAERWDETRTELEVIKASRPQVGPFVNTGAGGDVAPELVLGAAICAAGGLNDIEKQFEDRVLQAAHTRYRGRISLQQIILEAAWAGGYSGAHFDRSASGMRDILRAAFSTLSLPGILSSTANKFLLQGFNAVESTWRAISAVRPVNDFKQVTSYRLTGNFEFEEVGSDGQLKHGETGEASFTNQARTYGRMYAITRQDIINDDLGALTVVPQRIGRGGGLKLNRVFWTEFLDNASFFTSGNGNYSDGAATALSIDALTAAELLFLNQTDPDGDPLAIMPSVLLVPNALNVTAAQIMRSTELRDTTASTKAGTTNPHAGKFAVQRSSYLSNSTIPGNSTKAWYLLADPAELPVIETVFLNGVQQPTVESADADFNTLGIQMRGYFDFGVSKQEHRAGVKMKGEA